MSACRFSSFQVSALCVDRIVSKLHRASNSGCLIQAAPVLKLETKHCSGAEGSPNPRQKVITSRRIIQADKLVFHIMKYGTANQFNEGYFRGLAFIAFRVTITLILQAINPGVLNRSITQFLYFWVRGRGKNRALRWLCIRLNGPDHHRKSNIGRCGIDDGGSQPTPADPLGTILRRKKRPPKWQIHP